jgi:enoyl-CoA hydratase/carnithine racemase
VRPPGGRGPRALERPRRAHPRELPGAGQRVAAGGDGRLTLAAAKEATRRILAAFTVREAEDLLSSCCLSEDFQEGVRAFLDNCRPERKGR